VTADPRSVMVDREALAAAQAVNDALGAHLELKRAFTADVYPFAPWRATAAGIV
jgi:L-rhamnose isomerase / sugar isomerase